MIWQSLKFLLVYHVNLFYIINAYKFKKKLFFYIVSIINIYYIMNFCRYLQYGFFFPLSLTHTHKHTNTHENTQSHNEKKKGGKSDWDVYQWNGEKVIFIVGLVLGVMSRCMEEFKVNWEPKLPINWSRIRWCILRNLEPANSIGRFYSF